MRTILNTFVTILLASVHLLAQVPTEPPTGFRISISTPTSIRLLWGAPGTVDANRTNYLILANTTGTFMNPTQGMALTNDVDLTDGFAASFGVIDATDILFEGFTVNPGTQYFFKIYPYNASGTSPPQYYLSTDITTNGYTLARGPGDGTASFSAAAVSGTTNIKLTFEAASGLTNADGFLILRRQSNIPSSSSIVDGIAPDSLVLSGGTSLVTTINSTTTTTFTDVGLAANTKYHYAILSYNANASQDGQTFNYLPSRSRHANATTDCAAPTTQAGTVTFGTTQSGSVVVNWVRGNGNNVIVVGRQGAALPVTPNSGTSYTANASFGNGNALAVSGNDYFVVYNGPLTTIPVTNLNANTNYNFKVFEYDTANTCYNVGNTASNDVTTNVPSANSTITAGGGVVTIASTADTNIEKVNSFTFTVRDIGDDGLDTDFTRITFRPGSGNNVTDWREVIAGVELTDNASNGPEDYSGDSVTANMIQFYGIDTSDQLGDINDGATKIYTLKVWLRSNLQGSLPTTIDGLNLAFSVHESDIITQASMSSFASGQTTESGATNNKITVTATQIKINRQPSTTATTTLALTQQPIFEATDQNNNRDLSFNNVITVNTGNPDNLGPASAPASFGSGIADFTTSGFNFRNIGMSTMSVTANTITSPNSDTITVTTATILAGGAIGTATGPNINSGTTNQAVLGFSLQTMGGSRDFIGIMVSTTSDPDLVFSNLRIFSSLDNDFATTGDNMNIGAIATTPSLNSINFEGFTSSISSVIKYFFVVADVNNSFLGINPTIQLSLTTANTSVSVGSTVGTTQTGTSYTFFDTTPPTILSITNNVNPIFEGALTQTVVVQFSESMNATGTFNPAITLTGTNWGAQAAGSWSTTTFINDTYTTTFLHSAAQDTIAKAVATISVNTPRDIAGNPTTNAPQSSGFFVVDNLKPTGTVTTSPAVITTNNPGALQVRATYNEAMNPGINPTINLSDGSFGPAPAGVWSAGNTVYTVNLIHNGTLETIDTITATTSGAQDAGGNEQVLTPASNAFAVDTQGPTVLSFNRQNPITTLPINNTSVVFRVTFSEPVSGINSSDFTKVQPGLNSGAVIVNPINSSTYDVTVPSIDGNGTLQLNVLKTATITDVAGNDYNTSFTSGQIFNIDNTPPSLISLLPADNRFSVPIIGGASKWVISYNEPIKAGTGNITIFRSSDDAVIATIPIGGAAINISNNTVNIIPSGNTPSPVMLAEGTDYYVQIPSGVILDIANNPYAGFVNKISWNFQTYSPPTISGIIKSPSANSLAACVDQVITVNGKFFSGYNVGNGIASVTFYDDAGKNPVTTSSGITIKSATSLTVIVPPTSSITTQTQVKLTSKTEIIPNLGTNTGALSTNFSSLINLGPSSATMALFTPGQFEVCSTGVTDTRNIKVTTSGGNSGTLSYEVIYSITGAILSANGSIGSYTSADSINVNPPGVGNYDYAIVSVTDKFGCPSPLNFGSATIREYTANTITLNSTNQPIPVCLANTPNATIALNTTIKGSSVARALFSRGNGQGGWPTSSTMVLSGASPTVPPTDQTFTTTSTYTFNIQDYALPAATPLTLMLSTTGSNAVCQEASLPVVVTFATSASGSINANNPTPLCQNATPTNTTVTLNGTVTGGAASGVWQAFSDAGAATNITSPTNFTGGTYFADISNIASGFSGPGYQTSASAGSVSIVYTYSDFNNGVAHFRLIPTGGTCGTSNASGIYTVTANPIQSPTPGSNPLNGCLGDQKFYSVSQTPGSTYQWSNPSGNITILAGQGTSTIFVRFNAIGSNTLKIIETAANGCPSLPVTISINVNDIPTVSFLSPTERSISNSIDTVNLQGSGTGGSKLFVGSGVFKTANDEWYFGPKNASIGATLPATIPIEYTFTEPTTGCSNSVKENFIVYNGRQAFLKTNDTVIPTELCADDNPINIKIDPTFLGVNPITSGKLISYIAKIASVSGHNVSLRLQGGNAADGSDLVATFDPASFNIVGQIPQTVRITVFKEIPAATITPQSTITPTATRVEYGFQDIIINPTPSLAPLSPAKSNFCSTDTPVNLEKNNTINPSVIGTNFSFFLDMATAALYPGIITGSDTTGFQLNPSAYNSLNFDPESIKVFYRYQNVNGCSSTTTVANGNVINLIFHRQPPQPVIDIGADICITDGTTVPIATVNNMASNSSGPANVKWYDNPGLNLPISGTSPDFTPSGTIVNPKINNTEYFYVVQDIDGCISAPTQVRYEVLNVPSFSWNNFCINGNATSFELNLGSINATDLTWIIRKSDSSLETSQSVTPGQKFLHSFTSGGRYNVTAQVTSMNSCVATKTLPVIQLEQFVVTEAQIYSEDFEGGNGGFVALTDNNSMSPSTWEYGVINKKTIKNPNNNLSNLGWVTNLNGTYNNGERSYLYSGCLDITGLTKPLISLSSWTNTDDKNDGVVLQYSVDSNVINDPTKEWNALGNIGTGTNWYNRQLIQSIPGDKPAQNYGWSGDFDTGWKNSKHSLDNVAGALQKEGSNSVVFRFAFAATKSQTPKLLDGFAIDSIFIGNRTRIILLENFTNKGNASNAALEASQSNAIRLFNPGGLGTRLIKINYHVGFPGEDPFNKDNTADPSARALYYNITGTPAARLDGEKPDGPEKPFLQWGEQIYNLRTLQLSQAKIIITHTSNTDGSIGITVGVTPNTNLPQGTKLHIAILEEQISESDLPPTMQNLIQTNENSFEFVLKRMLPNALGIDTGPLVANTLYNFGPLTWFPEPTRLYGQPNDLAVVAFLQDELSKEIYQAEIVTRVSDPPIVTGVNESIVDRIGIFPNPADGEITVYLPSPAPNYIEVQMVDQMGRVTNNSTFDKGEQSKVIYTHNMAAGIYMLQFGSGTTRTYKKIMVVHDE